MATSTLEEAGRGEQRTPSGIREIHHCQDCGARDATSTVPTDAPTVAQDRARLARSPGTRDEEPTEPPSHHLADTRRVDSAFGVFAPDQLIGDRWRLVHVVHWSSTGSLWLAQAIDADRQVVFKLVHPRLTTDRRVAALHVGAARAGMQVRHPNLLPVLDVKVRDTDVLIVVPAVDGRTLHATSRLAPDRLQRVAAHLARAVSAMHDRETTHLDIRPDKILLDDTDTPRLIDLGTGRVRAAHRTTTSTSSRMAFQAPEQVVSRSHGPRADVYSLGLTLWTLAGGDLQAMGPNATAQATYRLTHHVPRLDPATTALPTPFVDAISAATVRPAQQRPTAAQVARMLEDAAPSST